MTEISLQMSSLSISPTKADKHGIKVAKDGILRSADEVLAQKLLEKFNWGHTFLDLNENLLCDYQKATSEEQVIQIIREYGYEYN